MTLSRQLITALLIGILGSNNANATQILDRIIAIVDEDVITQVELEQRTNDIRYQLKRPISSPEELQALVRQVLEKMIRDKIQLQQAEKYGIKIDDVSLNRVLEQIANSNNVTLQQLQSTLETDGINFTRFREQTREELIIKQLQQRLVANKVNVSDQEVDQFIEENNRQSQANIRYRLRHILISTPESAKPEQVQQAKSKAELLYEKITAGEDFAELAVKESSGRFALQGGDLGWREVNELPGDFVKQLRNLNTGETTKPIRSASGFHILQLIDTSQQQNTVIQTRSRHILIKDDGDDDAARDQLKQILQRIKQGENFSELAQLYSQDPGSSNNGGDLGWADPGTFVPAFESTMQTLKNNEISEPFKSRFGWHILQVLDRREQSASKQQLASQAKLLIRKRKIDEELRLWLRKIRDEAYVEYIDTSLEIGQSSSTNK